MKKSSFLALAIAPMIMGAPFVNAQPVYTDAVGFVKFAAAPGETEAVGVTLLHPAVVAGLVASSDADSITLDGDHTVEADLDGGTAYYVEVASGDTWEGERFEVDVAASGGSTLAISTSSLNTVSLGATDLSGHSVRVRAHRTLADIFDVDELTAGADQASSDNVLTFNGETFETYWLREGDFIDPTNAWRRVGGGTTNQNNVILPPGMGVLFRNSGASAVELTTNIGEVRTNNFRQPLPAGMSLIAEGHPVDNSPNSRAMIVENGFQAGSDQASSDNVLVFDGEVFETYWLREGDFIDPTDAWRKVGGGTTNFSDDTFILADGAIFVRKLAADDQYEAPKNF